MKSGGQACTLQWKVFMSAVSLQDLAARNVLVSRDETCKVADFGLSREVVDDEYNVQKVWFVWCMGGVVCVVHGRCGLCGAWEVWFVWCMGGVNPVILSDREARSQCVGLPLRPSIGENSLPVVMCGVLVC